MIKYILRGSVGGFVVAGLVVGRVVGLVVGRVVGGLVGGLVTGALSSVGAQQNGSKYECHYCNICSYAYILVPRTYRHLYTLLQLKYLQVLNILTYGGQV